MEYKYFNKSEFACKCCGENKIQDSFIEALNAARYISDTPYVITSGYRCEKHNKDVGGVFDSAHIKGWAADIHVSSNFNRLKIIKGLLAAGINRIGISKEFIHADIDPFKPRGSIWTY